MSDNNKHEIWGIVIIIACLILGPCGCTAALGWAAAYQNVQMSKIAVERSR